MHYDGRHNTRPALEDMTMDDDATKWQELSVKKLFKIGFKVKDCPFCGSSDIHANHAPETSTAYMVCMSCYSTGPMQTSLAAAVDKWNYPMQIRATFTGKEWVCDTGEVMATGIAAPALEE